MKAFIRTASFTVSLVASLSAFAALGVYEGFDYTVGNNVTTESAAGPGSPVPSFGWAAPWTGSTSAPGIIASGSLIPLGLSFTLPETGNQVEFQAPSTGNTFSERLFGPVVTQAGGLLDNATNGSGGEFWISFVASLSSSSHLDLLLQRFSFSAV